MQEYEQAPLETANPLGLSLTLPSAWVLLLDSEHIQSVINNLA